ncbi:MAG: hypothetical protein HY026_05320 [Deltaproteobacteria bacterium]|nr:hypothetical protein [Deltaproteobacteria bacterium]
MEKTGYRPWAIGKYFLPFVLPIAYCLLPIASCLFFIGCASTKGHVTLMPMPAASPEYDISGQKITFSNQDVKISILPIKPSEVKKMLAGKDANNPLAEILAAPQYLAFRLDMENSSKAKIMYNPALTTLFDNTMGVHKPLDYTDLYTLIGDSPSPEAVINTIKDIIYDLAVTLAPGQHTSRLLIFSGIEEGISEVAITMKEIYIGTSTIAVSFGFRIQKENE